MKNQIQTLRNILSYTLTITLILLAAYWCYGNWGRIEQAFSLNLKYLLFLIPLIFITMLLNGLLNQVVISQMGIPLRFVQWAGIAYASTFANYVLPMGAGAAIRAEYYKQNFGLSYSRFSSSMIVVYVTMLLSNSIIGILAILYLRWYHGMMSISLFYVFLIVASISLILLAFSPKPSKKGPMTGISGILFRIHTGWDELRQSPSLLLKTLAISFAITAIYAIRLHIAFRATGHSVSAVGCLMVATLVAISMFISITPASLGIREAAVVFASIAIKVSPEISIMAGAIDRALAVIIVFIIGPIAMIVLTRKKNLSHNFPKNCGQKD